MPFEYLQLLRSSQADSLNNWQQPPCQCQHKSTALTNDAVSLVQMVGVANAVGMEVREAGQPHSGVSVREGEGDAV